jgi:hypothetical protein
VFLVLSTSCLLMIYKCFIVIGFMAKLLQCDVNSVQNWCFENVLILNVGKTGVISFTVTAC